MHDKEHLLDALARRVSGDSPAASWIGVPVAMERRTLTLLFVDRPEPALGKLDHALDLVASAHVGSDADPAETITNGGRR